MKLVKKFENLSVKLAKIGHKNISSVKVGVHPLRLLVFKARNVEQLGVCVHGLTALICPK